MTIGYVLITAEPGKEGEISGAISEIPEVTESFPLFGDFDMIAKIEADGWSGIGMVVSSSIRDLSGVIGTKTLMGLNKK